MVRWRITLIVCCQAKQGRKTLSCRLVCEAHTCTGITEGVWLVLIPPGQVNRLKKLQNPQPCFQPQLLQARQQQLNTKNNAVLGTSDQLILTILILIVNLNLLAQSIKHCNDNATRNGEINKAVLQGIAWPANKVILFL